jgi:hypothetical protein
MNTSLEYIISLVKEMASSGRMNDGQQISLCDSIISTVLKNEDISDGDAMRYMFLGWYVSNRGDFKSRGEPLQDE